MSAVYLDANAGTHLDHEVAEQLARVLRERRAELSNPSSIHSFGRDARRFLSESREAILKSLSPSGKTGPEQLVLTSSGSEANQTVIRSFAESNPGSFHWITTPVEHDSVLAMVPWIKRRGGRVSFLPVDSSGALDPYALENLWQPDQPTLVSVVWANNETGVLSPIQKIADFVGSHNGLLHVDGAQAWGKIPFDLAESPADYVTFSGHKIGGLPGVGVLYLKKGRAFEPLMPGNQELKRRGGTENLLAIISAGFAAQKVYPEAFGRSVRPLRDRLEGEVLQRISGACVNGAETKRVGNTSNFSFDGLAGESLVMAMDLGGYAVSAGSACSSGALEPSHVLVAMGKSEAEAKAAIRVSITPRNTWEELQGFVDTLEEAVARARKNR